jgi:hypothetical protein
MSFSPGMTPLVAYAHRMFEMTCGSFSMSCAQRRLTLLALLVQKH